MVDGGSSRIGPGDGAAADGMSTGGDLGRGAVTAALPDRPLRTYPALMSTEAEAMAWGRQGAPGGALVVAGYQASPRGRSGLEREGLVEAGRGLGFSLVLRPELPSRREGWPYVTGALGVHDVLAADHPGEEVVIVWPDEVHVGGELAAALGVHTEQAPSQLRFVVITVLLGGVTPPRAPMLARLVEAIEARSAEATEDVRRHYRDRCTTLGRVLTARLLPMGPAGTTVTGRADDVLEDGALVVEHDSGARVAVPAHELGRLETPGDEPDPPPEAGL